MTDHKVREHFVASKSFSIECVCGRVFNELTEDQATRRFIQHVGSTVEGRR